MNKTTLTRILTAVAIVGATVFLASDTKTYYVSQSGSGTICTETSPCSYSEGIKQVQPGERVFVVGTITSAINLNKSGTENNPITFEGGVYDGSNFGSGSGSNVVSVTGSYIVVKNTEIRNGYGFGIRTNGDYIELDNVYAHHNVRRFYNGTTCTNSTGGWEAGIRISPGSDFVTVKNSRSWLNCGEGIGVLAGSNATIINNDVRNNWSVNIYIDQANYATASDNISICDNANYYRSGIQSRGITFGAEGYGVGNIIGAQVLRNTIQGCKGIYFYAQVSSKLQDSTIALNDLSKVAGVAISLPANTVGSNVNIYGNVGSVSAPGATLVAIGTGTVFPPSPTYTITRTVTSTITKTDTVNPTITRTLTPTLTKTPPSTSIVVTGTFTPTNTKTLTPTPTPECHLFVGKNVLVCLP